MIVSNLGFSSLNLARSKRLKHIKFNTFSPLQLSQSAFQTIIALQFISFVYLKCIFHIWLFIFTDSRIISVANFILSFSHNIHNLLDDAMKNMCYVQISYLYLFLCLFTHLHNFYCTLLFVYLRRNNVINYHLNNKFLHITKAQSN